MLRPTIIDGDILQKGTFFYRVCNVGRDIVTNRVLYNTTTEKLQIAAKYEYVEWHEIGQIYNLIEPDDRLNKLELIKRKYKLQKIKQISEENGEKDV